MPGSGHLSFWLQLLLPAEPRQKRTACVAAACIRCWLIAGATVCGNPGEWDFTNSRNNGDTAMRQLSCKTARLVVGGTDSYLASSKLHDPATALWSTTGSLTQGRELLTVTLLPNGMVLAAGGIGTGFINLKSAELYDPAIGACSTTGSMTNARHSHTGTLPQNGMLLVAGGPLLAVIFRAPNSTIPPPAPEQRYPAGGALTSGDIRIY
jgi:hypothetical protein